MRIGHYLWTTALVVSLSSVSWGQTVAPPAATSTETPSGGLVQPVAFWEPLEGERQVQVAPALEPLPLATPMPIRRLTLPEMETLALQSNPTIAQAYARVEAAEGKHLQVGLYPNPVLGYASEELGIDNTAGQQGGFVEQQIVTTGKLKIRRNAASHEIVQAKCHLAAQRQRVINDVRIGWYNALVTQEVVRLNERLVEIGQKSQDTAQQLFNAKEVSRVDVLQAKIEADSARLKLFDAKNQHVAAWRQLVAVVGIPRMEPTDLVGDLNQALPQLSWDDSLSRLLSQSPELGQARAGVQRAQCELAEQRAMRIPNIEFAAAVLHHNPAQQTVGAVEVGWPLPLINRNQGNIMSAQAQLVSSRREVARLELALQDRLAIAFARYANARNEVEKYSTVILPNAKTSLELVEQGYRQGEFDYLKLLTAQRTYFRSNLAYLDSLLEAHVEALRIEGLLLGGGLGEMPEDEGLRIFRTR